MNVTLTARENKPCNFVLAGELTIYTAQELKGQLLAPFDQCADLEIDLAGVSEIDSAGLQLLILLKQESLARGKTLRLTGHSPPVLEILDLCKLESFFGDPVLIWSQER
jgi:anti-anti-sigma factor